MYGLTFGAAGALLLHGFFSVVRSKWPQNYFSQTSNIEYRTSRGRASYVVFRFAPVAAVLLLVSVTALRVEARPGVAALTAATLHVLDTSGRVLYEAARRLTAHRATSMAQFTLALATSIPIFMLAVAAILLGDPLRSLVPTPDKFLESLWTAALTAVVTALVLDSTRKSMDLPDVVRLQHQKLEEQGLITLVQDAARRNNTSPDFLLSILITEDLQRPRWFRRLESALSRIRGEATYGVMQVRAPSVVSDKESIDATARQYNSYMPEYGASSVVEPYLREALYRHNGDDNFVDMAMEVYSQLAPAPYAATVTRAADGRPTIEVDTPEQRVSSWWITGSACAYEGTLQWRYTLAGEEHQGTITLAAGAPVRSRWDLDVPLRVMDVHVGEPQEADHVPEDSDRWVAVSTHYIY